MTVVARRVMMMMALPTFLNLRANDSLKYFKSTPIRSGMIREAGTRKTSS